MKRTLLMIAVVGVASQAMATQYFNSTSSSNRDDARTDFLAAAGVAGGQFFQNFESYDLGQNMLGVDVGGGLTIGNSGSGLVDIRGDNAFGGSDPIDTKGLWHNESAWLELNFTGGPASYIGGIDIDHGSGTIRVTYTDTTTETFVTEGTGAGGDSGEFWGLVSENDLFITKVEFDVSGDRSWGLDNLEYGVVPEPATMSLLGLGAAALVARRRKKA